MKIYSTLTYISLLAFFIFIQMMHSTWAREFNINNLKEGNFLVLTKNKVQGDYLFRIGTPIQITYFKRHSFGQRFSTPADYIQTHQDDYYLSGTVMFHTGVSEPKFSIICKLKRIGWSLRSHGAIETNIVQCEDGFDVYDSKVQLVE